MRGLGEGGRRVCESWMSGEVPDREDEFIQELLCRLYGKQGMRS